MQAQGEERTGNRHIDQSPPPVKERKNAGKMRPPDGQPRKRRPPLSHLFSPQRTREPFSCKKRQTLFPEPRRASNSDAMPWSKQALHLAQHPMDLRQHPMDFSLQGLHFCLQNAKILLLPLCISTHSNPITTHRGVKPYNGAKQQKHRALSDYECGATEKQNNETTRQGHDERAESHPGAAARPTAATGPKAQRRRSKKAALARRRSPATAGAPTPCRPLSERLQSKKSGRSLVVLIPFYNFVSSSHIKTKQPIETSLLYELKTE